MRSEAQTLGWPGYPHLDDPVVEGVLVDLIRFLDGDVHQSHPRGTARRLVRQQRAGRVVTHLSPRTLLDTRCRFPTGATHVATSQRQFAVVDGTRTRLTNRRDAIFRALPDVRRPVPRARVCRGASRRAEKRLLPAAPLLSVRESSGVDNSRIMITEVVRVTAAVS